MSSDASAAIGIVQRTGLGKVRHLATADLWIQQKIKNGEIEIAKVPGKINPADLLRKSLDRARADELLKLMGIKRISSKEGSVANG